MPRKLRTAKTRTDLRLSPATRYFLMTGLNTHTHVCGADTRGRWRCEADPTMVPCAAKVHVEGQWEVLLRLVNVGDMWMAHRDALITEAARCGFEPAGAQWEKGTVPFPKPIDVAQTATWRRQFMGEYGGEKS
jgi:hypothetical protein